MAQAKAEALGHPYINPQHVLWALIQDQDSYAAHVFDDLVQPQESNWRKSILWIFQRPRATPSSEQKVLLAEDTRRLLYRVVDEVRRRNDFRICTHDLLVAIRRLSCGAAMTMLDRFGIGLGLLRKTIKVVMGRYPDLS